jgi:hypothetical protein
MALAVASNQQHRQTYSFCRNNRCVIGGKNHWMVRTLPDPSIQVTTSYAEWLQAANIVENLRKIMDPSLAKRCRDGPGRLKRNVAHGEVWSLLEKV